MMTTILRSTTLLDRDQNLKKRRDHEQSKLAPEQGKATKGTLTQDLREGKHCNRIEYKKAGGSISISFRHPVYIVPT